MLFNVSVIPGEDPPAEGAAAGAPEENPNSSTVGAAAPPGTEVLTASFPITVAGGAIGVADFGMPTAGWPAGRYQVEVARGTEVFGTVDTRYLRPTFLKSSQSMISALTCSLAIAMP